MVRRRGAGSGSVGPARNGLTGVGVVRMNRKDILRFRLAAQHLNVRLPPERVTDAAAGGLQDTVPRAALFGLHARSDAAAAGSWEDPALFQTYGPRMAVYLLP